MRSTRPFEIARPGPVPPKSRVVELAAREKGDASREAVGQVEGLAFDHGPAGLDLRTVENVVENRQEARARGLQSLHVLLLGVTGHAALFDVEGLHQAQVWLAVNQGSLEDLSFSRSHAVERGVLPVVGPVLGPDRAAGREVAPRQAHPVLHLQPARVIYAGLTRTSVCSLLVWTVCFSSGR